MAPFNEHMLRSLQQVVETWSTEMTDTPEALADEISEARKLLLIIIGLLREQLGLEPASIPTAQDLSPLQESIDILRDELRVAVEENQLLRESPGESNPDLSPQLSETIKALQQANTLHGELQEQHGALSQQYENLRDEQQETKVRLSQVEQESQQQRHESEIASAAQIQLEADMENHRDTATTAERYAHQLKENEEALRVENNRLKSELETLQEAFAEVKISRELSLNIQDQAHSKDEEAKHAKATQWLRKIQRTTLALQDEITTLRESMNPNTKPDSDTALLSTQSHDQIVK